MARLLAGLAALALAASSAPAQEPAPVYQAEKKHSFTPKLEVLLRQEWTRDIFPGRAPSPNQDRQRLQVRPGLEMGLGKLVLGVGGDLNYSSDNNADPRPVVLRDNYDSRDARLDLAYARFNPTAWIALQGGRFEMPVALTEMIWDRDLRPQGAALTLETRDKGALKRLAVTALAARGSHVFGDRSDMALGSADATFGLGEGDARLQLTASFASFTRLGTLERAIRRQNTRVAGALVKDYRVVDGVARLRFGSSVQLVADLCWNTAVDADRRGLWLAAVIGSLKSGRVRGEYVFAEIEDDATLAAYGADDYLWVTGWVGHKAEVGVRVAEHLSAHAIGQLQRFYGSPVPAEQDHWTKRFRLELRLTY